MFEGFYDVSKRGELGKNIWNELESYELIYLDPDAQIPTLQYKWEFDALLSIIRKHVEGNLIPYSLMEIGCWKGGSLNAFIRNMPKKSNILGLSHPQDTQIDERIWDRATYHDINLKIIIEDSHSREALIQTLDFFKAGIDVLFIDGDHTYEGVKQDFMTYGKMVKPGGLIILQDIIWAARHPEVMVSKLWAEIREAGYKIRELYTSPLQGGLGIGVVYLD